MAFIAYYFNWSREEVLEVPHQERKRWCEEISRINEELNPETNSSGDGSEDTPEGGELPEPDLAVPRPEDFGLPPDAF